MTSSATLPFDSPSTVSYWWSCGTNKPLSLPVSEIFNGECDAMIDVTILVPIDSSYTASYRLSIVTFALGLAV